MNYIVASLEDLFKMDCSLITNDYRNVLIKSNYLFEFNIDGVIYYIGSNTNLNLFEFNEFPIQWEFYNSNLIQYLPIKKQDIKININVYLCIVQ